MTKYRFIAILDSVKEQGLSNIDLSPDYLHIHIALSEYCQTIPNFYNELSRLPNSTTLYQWGTPLEKNAKIRSEKVNASKIKNYGNIGIGSAGIGDGEHIKDFVGGGEAFLFNQLNIRTIKGGRTVLARDKETYWTFQTAQLSKSNTGIVRGYNEEIVSRRDLRGMFKVYSAGRPFIATFDAEFTSPFLARSNGIYKEDLAGIERPRNSVFDQNISGGHLLGGSSNPGDIESLRAYYAGRRYSEERSFQRGFSIRFSSDILLSPINNVQIATEKGFRKPRTTTEVYEATQLIQTKYRDHLASR